MSSVSFMELSCAVPNDVVVHSPTPSMDKTADSLNGDV